MTTRKLDNMVTRIPFEKKRTGSEKSSEIDQYRHALREVAMLGDTPYNGLTERLRPKGVQFSGFR